MIDSILVVCVGNICRSPMAEGLLRQSLPACRVSSAGIAALVGQPADPIAVDLMQGRELDITPHRARQIDGPMAADAGLILVMELGHKRHLEQIHPLARGKIFRLCESAQADVPDPYQRGREAFEKALALIVQGVDAWVPRIEALNAARSPSTGKS
jgi:protein-tyrosine phosphatase